MKAKDVRFKIKIPYSETQLVFGSTTLLLMQIMYELLWFTVKLPHFATKVYRSVLTSVVDPNTLNLDPDPGFWADLDPDPDPGLYNQF